MDFYIWVNSQIIRFLNQLQKHCNTSKDFNEYKEKFSKYCADCINEYEQRLELESSLKYEVVRESISLVREAEYYSSL